MDVYLIASKGRRKGFAFLLPADLFLIGADPVCNLRSFLPGIAPRHCAVLCKNRRVTLLDLDSGEPVFVNGELVPPNAEWLLHQGDRVEVGPLEFQVQYTELKLERNDLEEWGLRCIDNREKNRVKEDENIIEHRKNYEAASEVAQKLFERLADKVGSVKGRLRVGREDDVVVVRLLDALLVDEGELSLLRKELGEAVPAPNERVLLDFKSVRRLTTHAAAMFNDFAKRLCDRGSRLAVCRLDPDLERVIRSLPQLVDLPYFDTLESALSEDW